MTDDAGRGASAAASPVEVRKLSPRGRKRLVAAAVAGAGPLVTAAAIVLAVVWAGNGPDGSVRVYL